ncbi:hypothetical protein BXZ70DRAFT_1060606 [Cristinia sonorae]|uniref:SnoaL-like domain-containing protein n=1 Tax=Cristinia sonorae TaxID=1940300 RepID=A0A8K0UYF1_9AGAR|nr:hypothetical protein BXZ70DRAFT_1060606 [Cristinia sonorae]
MPLTKSCPIPNSGSPLAPLALQFAEAMTASNLDGVSETLAEEYHHAFLPGAMFPAFTSKGNYLNHLKGIFPMFGEITADLKEFIVSAEGDTVVLHFSVSGRDTFGVPYANDNLFIFRGAKQPDGTTKFIVCKEFINTKAIAEMMERTKLEGHK